jgi:hypothetical protein
MNGGGLGGGVPLRPTEEGGTPEVWYNGGFISFEEYQKSKPDSYQQKTDRFSAIVQPIFTGVKGAIFDLYGHVFGCNEKPDEDDCGKIRAKILCVVDNCDYSYFKHHHCNNPYCPICYPKFCRRLTDGVTERVHGYRSVFGFDPIYHLVFWPDSLTGYSGLTEAMKDAKFMLEKLGTKMAVVWYHPYRIRTEIKEQLRRYRHRHRISQLVGFWQMAHDDVLDLGCLDAYIVYGPHFHAIASGYLQNYQDYAKRGIGGYKKVRVLDSDEATEKTAYYISTHACREAKKSTVRYFGKISYRKIGCDAGTAVIEDVLCEKCGGYMEERYCDENGVVGDLHHKRVTRTIMKYKYWKRGDKAVGVRKLTRQEQIWGRRLDGSAPGVVKRKPNDGEFEAQCEQVRLDRLKMGIT